MRVLIFEAWHVAPQFETGLELAELQSMQGNDVYYVNIGGHLPYVEWYRLPKNRLVRFLYKLSVQFKVKRAKRLLPKKIQFSTKLLLSKGEVSKLHSDLRFNNIDHLKAYEWEGIDLGMAAASSYITDTNDLDPNTIERANLINSILHSSRVVAKSFSKWLKKVEPDLVLFRNGRVASYRPLLRICQRLNLNFLVHDRGCDKDHYSLGPTYRHDWNMRKKEMMDLWEKSGVENKEEIGKLFFEERKRRSDDSHIVFAKNQSVGLLPPSWDDTKYNVVFFNSSISEYVAVGDEVNPHILFPSQQESIAEIEKILSERTNTKFYLRLHPNLLNQSAKEKDIWMNMASNNTELILPDSKVDTYSLIEQADLVICYLSTVGVEAAYSNTPVIILGRAIYEDLEVAYKPDSKNKLKDLLMADKLAPKNPRGAFIFGFYMKTHGERYNFFEAIDHRSGVYKGTNLQKYDLKKVATPLVKLRRNIFN